MNTAVCFVVDVGVDRDARGRVDSFDLAQDGDYWHRLVDQDLRLRLLLSDRMEDVEFLLQEGVRVIT